MSEERWKDVEGYEEYFMISDHGNVWSKRSNKLLKLNKNGRGYLAFSTRFDGRNSKAVSFRIHVLVAKAFVDNPDDKPFVNHDDGIKTNNFYKNLEWCTGSENTLHAYRNNLINTRRGEDAAHSKASDEIVDYIRTNYVPRSSKFGARALGRKFNLHHSTVLSIINKETWI